MKDRTIYLIKNYYHLLDVDLAYWHFHASNALHYNYRSALHPIATKKCSDYNTLQLPNTTITH